MPTTCRPRASRNLAVSLPMSPDEPVTIATDIQITPLNYYIETR
jgi:hypothetical protein